MRLGDERLLEEAGGVLLVYCKVLFNNLHDKFILNYLVASMV